MSRPAKYVPKHRAAPAAASVSRLPRKALRTTVVLSTAAAGMTGAAVAGGVFAAPTTPAAEVISGSQADLSAAAVRSLARDEANRNVVSRDSDRTASTSSTATSTGVDLTKAAALAQTTGGGLARTEQLDTSDPRAIAKALLPEFGFSTSQFGCLDSLWMRESGWRVNADNPSSSAYGIPQALPGSKMASAGADWATNPETQIRWGLGYIRDRYGSPCGAWSHSESHGFY